MEPDLGLILDGHTAGPHVEVLVWHRFKMSADVRVARVTNSLSSPTCPGLSSRLHGRYGILWRQDRRKISQRG